MLRKHYILLLPLFFFGNSTNVWAEQEMRQAATPQDMTEFTCIDFEQKAKDCEIYTCQTPSIFDPTQAMNWKIVEKKNNRCVISSTINDVGLKDDNGNPKPITKTCEYDEVGISALNDLMSQLSSGYFSPSNAGDIQGTHNCGITSDGNPIKPTPYTIAPDSDQ